MNLNSNILPFTTNINNINDIKLLYRDANSMDEVWNKLVDTYINNKESFDKEQSETFVKNFNSIINDYILVYTNSDYNNNIYSNNLNIKNINSMVNSYYNIINIHENKYNEIIDDIYLYSFNENDSQSKLNKNKLREIIIKLSDFVGIDPDTIISSDDPRLAIQKLCEKLYNLDKIEGIYDIYDNLNNLKSINEFELYKHDETSLNSEIIHKLYNTISKIIGIKVNEDVLISENNLKTINKNTSNNKKSKYEEFTDSVAFMILAAGREEDGFLAREYDENGDLVPISIKILDDGEEKSISIKNVIPSLRNLEGEELEKKFSYLYELASIYYSDNFESYYDENEKYAIFRENPMNTIRKSNALSHVIKAYNIREDDSIEKIDLSPDEVNLHLSNTNNNYMDENFLKFIVEVDENDLSNIDINNHEKLSTTFKDYWDETGMDKEMDSLYKAMAIHCVKNTKCKQYVKNNKDKLSFNIASYKTDSKGKETDNHTLIFNNDDSEETVHAFTFKENNGKYEIDENQEYSTLSYKELSSFNILNKPSIIAIDDKEYVMKPGIGLLAECEYEFKDSKGNTIKLNQYALPNDQFKNLINDEAINEKYETSNSGKYNMNLVDSSIFEVDTLIDDIEGDNDIESASLKQISKKLISKRYQNESNDYGKFDEYEIEMLDRYSNFILKEELNNNGQGVLHLTDSNESIVKSNDIKESVEINNSIKDVKNQKNGCMGNKSNNKCLKTIKIDETHDVEGSLSKLLRTTKDDDQSNIIKLKENEKVDLSKPENLCENSETLGDVIRNVLKISKMNKREQIIHLFHFLSGLLERYKVDTYLDHESIRDLNEDSFKDLITLFSEAVNLHDTENSEEKMSKSDQNNRFQI